MKKIILFFSLLFILVGCIGQTQFKNGIKVYKIGEFVDSAISPKFVGDTVRLTVLIIGDKIFTESELQSLGNISWDDSTKLYLLDEAGVNNTGTYFINIGDGAGSNNTGNYQIAEGFNAGDNNIAPYQLTFGTLSGQGNKGDNQITMGYSAGQDNEGDFVIQIGDGAGIDNIGHYVIELGDAAGYDNIGNHLFAAGTGAGMNNIGHYVIAEGYEAGKLNKGDSCLFLGYWKGKGNVINGRILIDPTKDSLIDGYALDDSLVINGVIYIRDSSYLGSSIKVGSTWFTEDDIGGGGTPGGVNTSIQFNDNNVFNGFGTWNGTYFKIGTDTVTYRDWVRDEFVQNDGGGGADNIAIYHTTNAIRAEGNLKWDDINSELEIDGGKLYFTTPYGAWIVSNATAATNSPAFKFYTLNTLGNTDTIVEIRNNTKTLLRIYDDSTTLYQNLRVNGNLKVIGYYPQSKSITGTYDSIAEVADSAGYLIITANMAGLELKDMQVSTLPRSDNIANVDRIVTVDIYRCRGATINKMTSTGATLGGEYTCSDEVINTSYDDILAGDVIYAKWSQTAGSTYKRRHKGLTIGLDFE